MAVALDGGMAPRPEANRQAKRQDAGATGTSPSGPAGYQAVGCATVSDYDRFGERRVTRRLAWVPDPHYATRQSQLTADGMGAVMQRPDGRVVKVADATAAPWTERRAPWPLGEAVVACSPAPDPLSAALSAA